MSNSGLKSKFSIYAKMGLIPKTSVLEEKEDALKKKFEAFNEYKNSDELARFKELETFVTSPEFETIKKEINAQKYPGSEPYKKEKEYKKLKNSKRIKIYYQVKDSKELKDFETFKTSEKLADYEDLKQFYESPEFDEFKKSLVQQKQEKTQEIKDKQSNYKTLKKKYRWFFKLKDSKTLADFKQLDGSPELEEYFSLKQDVDNHPDDKEKIKLFKSKSKSSHIKKYLKFKASNQYKEYLELQGSDEINDFIALEKEVNSAEFKKHIEEVKNLVYKNTEEYKNYLKYKKLQKSPEIKQYYKFKDSDKFAIYTELDGSEEIAHFEDLERYIQSDEFARDKKYLNTKDKFKLSDEYKQQQEYLELKKSEKIKWYFKLEKSNIFDEIKKWKLTFEDNFQTQKLDTAKWQTGYFWGKTLLEADYVQANERQFFTDDNIILDHDNLKIITQKQKTNGRVWHPVTGFYPQEFEYTSGLINTAQSFRQQYGLFKAKIKVDHSYPVHHAFWLRGEKITPEIDIFKYGKKSNSKLEITNYWTDQNTVKENRSVVSGLNFSKDYFIYSIEWCEQKITWKINDLVVHEQTKGVPNEPMYILLSSGITNKGEPYLPSYMLVDWIRVYKETITEED
ncbi:MAG: glycoside hydrolase family 16 protein [Bacteroidota bacterium]|nr:glycoside hydrolase family 16 protein [Bacteroidota bacterium]